MNTFFSFVFSNTKRMHATIMYEKRKKKKSQYLPFCFLTSKSCTRWTAFKRMEPVEAASPTSGSVQNTSSRWTLHSSGGKKKKSADCCQPSPSLTSETPTNRDAESSAPSESSESKPQVFFSMKLSVGEGGGSQVGHWILSVTDSSTLTPPPGF